MPWLFFGVALAAYHRPLELLVLGAGMVLVLAGLRVAPR
jgi:hypothetical protein